MLLMNLLCFVYVNFTFFLLFEIFMYLLIHPLTQSTRTKSVICLHQQQTEPSVWLKIIIQAKMHIVKLLIETNTEAIEKKCRGECGDVTSFQIFLPSHKYGLLVERDSIREH